MKLDVEVNFDFGKLANELPTMIDKFINESIDSTVKFSKDYIKDGKVTPDILKATKDRRARRGNPRNPPLYETGELYKSIQNAKEGMSIQQGGLWHHTGHGNPKRPFIGTSKEDMISAFEKFKKERKKAMHLSTPLVLKG